MNPFIKCAQLKQKLPGYSVARAHALNHQTLQHLAAHHREKFLKAFKYLQANVITGLQVSRGVASCKHDGISAYFYWEQGQQPFLFHMPSCGVEVGLPAAEGLAKALAAAGHTSALLVGELVIAGQRSHSYEVVRAINSPESLKALNRLHFVVFDVVLLDKQEKGNLNYAERVKVLRALPKTDRAYAAEFRDVGSLTELNGFYQSTIGAGHEGVVYHEAAAAHKIKPKFNIDLAIIGYVEGTGELAGHAVSVMGALIQGASHQLICRVGVANPAEREPLFQELSRNRLDSTYTEADSDSRPVVWVRPTRVMEINAEDIGWEDARGGEWTNAVLELQQNQFSYQGEGVTFKPFHPTLERLREDKPVVECSFAQLPGADLKLRQAATGQPARIFAREVFTKVLKGKTAVKKIVAWEQNRAEFPNFVIHTVDFSPDRAESLKEDTKATDDRSEADACIQAWRAEEIGKGWSPVHSTP